MHPRASSNPAWFCPKGQWQFLGEELAHPSPGPAPEGWGWARFPLTDTRWDGEQDLETCGCFKLWLHFANQPELHTEVSVGREHTFAE